MNVRWTAATKGHEKCWNGEEEKVVVLRELQRAIIYTRELSKQAIKGHVSTAFIVYWVNEGARLARNKSKATNRMRRGVRDANSEMRVRRSIAKEQQEQQSKGKQKENTR
jgi:hypothetical protein